MTQHFVVQHVSFLNGVDDFAFLARVGCGEHCDGFVHVGIEVGSCRGVDSLYAVLLQIFYEFVVYQFDAFFY